MTIFGLFIGWTLIVGVACLLAGWFLLPTPKFVVNLWAKLGLVDRVR